MVKNEGEPGGGPFWMSEANGGESLQIVEAAETVKDDEAQRAIFSRATHFNPVFMALSVHDEIIQIQAYRRFRHRLSSSGQPPYYVAVVARKLRDVNGFADHESW